LPRFCFWRLNRLHGSRIGWLGGPQCTERAFGACIGWNLSTCRLAAVEQETETASPSALLIRHQKYDNHPDGQNEHNVGEEVQHLSTGRFPVNQIRRKASWTENICCRLWNYLAAQRARGATKRGAAPHIRYGVLNRSCTRRVGHPEGYTPLRGLNLLTVRRWQDLGCSFFFDGMSYRMLSFLSAGSR